MTLTTAVPRPAAGSLSPTAVLLAILALGLALRVLGARGDLWTDEIWTLDLLTKIRRPDEIFWNISHDNNHFLNSLWMFVVGIGQPSLLYRLPSIAMGTASVALAARIGFRSSPAAGLLAGFIFAIAIPFVNYGSEARGYAGLILAVLVAIELLEIAISLAFEAGSARDFNRQRWRLGLAIGLGTLCHLTMVLGAGIIGLAAAAQLWIERPPGSRWIVVRAFLRLFGPSVVCLVPAAVALAAGILVRGRFTVGGTSYAPRRFAIGFGGMADAVLGLPTATPAWLALAIVGLGLAVAIRAKQLSPFRLCMALMGLVLAPALIKLANPPNTDFPRYFLVCGVIAALTMAEAAARAASNRHGRWLVPVLILLFSIGQGAQDLRLVVSGRGQVSRLVSAMAERPNPTYAGSFSTASQVGIDYHAAMRNVTLERVDIAWPCRAAPDWYVFDGTPNSGSAPVSLMLGPDGCPTQFIKALDVPTSSLSGGHWTLYARHG